ncbi:hypothetical protein N5923_07805 [Erwiniaceae bacterium BAC15a-03b]|uniref:Uncharacterized protein n=2 Tax=Erwiniaceae TaxID=1903409 RepID=A0A9J6PTM6_9GAMM|nr:hypothetical protein [Winslowiella arboricola]MCU5777391.1 hypothetical protein [Winslowiella arboricola]URQ62622.1 hypothetical protein LQ939_15425 [Pantoea alhagi]
MNREEAHCDVVQI